MKHILLAIIALSAIFIASPAYALNFQLNYTNEGYNPSTITAKDTDNLTITNQSDQTLTLATYSVLSRRRDPITLGTLNPGETTAINLQNPGRHTLFNQSNPSHQATITITSSRPARFTATGSADSTNALITPSPSAQTSTPSAQEITVSEATPSATPSSSLILRFTRQVSPLQLTALMGIPMLFGLFLTIRHQHSQSSENATQSTHVHQPHHSTKPVTISPPEEDKLRQASRDIDDWMDQFNE